MFTELVSTLGNKLLQSGKMLAVAESCTGGSVAAAITSVPGCSAWFERGYVTYSDAAKHDCLGVEQSIIQRFGAVSAQCVQEMATGVLLHSSADYSVAISGIAGPAGGTKQKPVGCIWFAFAGVETETQQKFFQGDRKSIVEQAVQFALQSLINYIPAD